MSYLLHFLVFNQTHCAARGVSFTSRGVSKATSSSRKQQMQTSSPMPGSSPRANSAWMLIIIISLPSLHPSQTGASCCLSRAPAMAGVDQRLLGLGLLVLVLQFHPPALCQWKELTMHTFYNFIFYLLLPFYSFLACYNCHKITLVYFPICYISASLHGDTAWCTQAHLASEWLYGCCLWKTNSVFVEQHVASLYHQGERMKLANKCQQIDVAAPSPPTPAPLLWFVVLST